LYFILSSTKKTPCISFSFLIGYEWLKRCQDGHSRRKDVHLTGSINFRVFLQAHLLTSASKTGFQRFLFPLFPPHVSLLCVYHIRFFFQQD